MKHIGFFDDWDRTADIVQPDSTIAVPNESTGQEFTPKTRATTPVFVELVFVIDTSPGMGSSFIDVKKLIIDFYNTLTGYLEKVRRKPVRSSCKVITFCKQSLEKHKPDASRSFDLTNASDVQLFENLVNSIEITNSKVELEAIIDALHMSINSLEIIKDRARQIVVMFTDAFDGISNSSQNDNISLIRHHESNTKDVLGSLSLVEKEWASSLSCNGTGKRVILFTPNTTIQPNSVIHDWPNICSVPIQYMISGFEEINLYNYIAYDI